MIRLGLPLFAAERWPTWFNATRRASGSLLPKCAKAAMSGAAARSPFISRALAQTAAGRPATGRGLSLAEAQSPHGGAADLTHQASEPDRVQGGVRVAEQHQPGSGG